MSSDLKEQLEIQRQINQRIARERAGIKAQPKQSTAKKKGRKNASTETTDEQAGTRAPEADAGPDKPTVSGSPES